MAKTPKQKTMAENHKVGTVLATGLFLIICLLIAFPLVCGLLGSFRDGAKVITTGMSLDLHSPVSMQNYSELFAIFHPKGMPADVLETSRKYFMWYKNSLVLTLTTVVLTLLVCYLSHMDLPCISSSCRVSCSSWSSRRCPYRLRFCASAVPGDHKDRSGRQQRRCFPAGSVCSRYDFLL